MIIPTTPTEEMSRVDQWDLEMERDRPMPTVLMTIVVMVEELNL
jgi:hypothetical protein